MAGQVHGTTPGGTIHCIVIVDVWNYFCQMAINILKKEAFFFFFFDSERSTVIESSRVDHVPDTVLRALNASFSVGC